MKLASLAGFSALLWSNDSDQQEPRCLSHSQDQTPSCELVRLSPAAKVLWQTAPYDALLEFLRSLLSSRELPAEGQGSSDEEGPGRICGSISWLK